MGRFLQLCAVALRDLAGLAGAGAIVFGVWQIHGPAGWIAGGLFALAAAFLLSRPSARRAGPLAPGGDAA